MLVGTTILPNELNAIWKFLLSDSRASNTQVPFSPMTLRKLLIIPGR